MSRTLGIRQFIEKISELTGKPEEECEAGSGNKENFVMCQRIEDFTYTTNKKKITLPVYASFNAENTNALSTAVDSHIRNGSK